MFWNCHSRKCPSLVTAWFPSGGAGPDVMQKSWQTDNFGAKKSSWQVSFGYSRKKARVSRSYVTFCVWCCVVYCRYQYFWWQWISSTTWNSYRKGLPWRCSGWRWYTSSKNYQAIKLHLLQFITRKYSVINANLKLINAKIHSFYSIDIH